MSVDASLERSNGSGPAAEGEHLVREGTACREPDCENPQNARWSRGPLAGLCWEIHVPAMRAHLADAGRSRSRHAKDTARLRIPPTPTPEPAPEPRAEAETEVAEPTLTELAADLERAERYFADAEEVYEDAVARFLAHPLVRAHVGYLDAATP